MSLPYKLISSDSHAEVLPKHRTHRVPAKYREAAPRRGKLPAGSDPLLVDGSAPIPMAIGVLLQDELRKAFILTLHMKGF